VNRVRQPRNIKDSATACDHRYNWQHVVIKTKYRYKMFKNPKTCKIVRDAIYDSAKKYGIGIREFAIGEDYAHIHIEIDVPVSMSVARAVQLLKGRSAHTVFKEMPRHRLRYSRGHFWAEKFSNSSVGLQDENTVQNYIKRQDVYSSVTSTT
jgi:REP element-mobilizing transposase RayT